MRRFLSDILEIALPVNAEKLIKIWMQYWRRGVVFLCLVLVVVALGEISVCLFDLPPSDRVRSEAQVLAALGTLALAVVAYLQICASLQQAKEREFDRLADTGILEELYLNMRDENEIPCEELVKSHDFLFRTDCYDKKRHVIVYLPKHLTDAIRSAYKQARAWNRAPRACHGLAEIEQGKKIVHLFRIAEHYIQERYRPGEGMPGT